MKKRSEKSPPPSAKSDVVRAVLYPGSLAALRARHPGRTIGDLVREALAAHYQMPELGLVRPEGRPWPKKDA